VKEEAAGDDTKVEEDVEEDSVPQITRSIASCSILYR